MRTLFCTVLFLCTFVAHGQTCHYGEGEKGFNADIRALRAERTCQTAYALYRKCLWGSSADPGRAEIVIQKCKSALKNRITPAQQEVLHDKLRLCSLECEGMDGTLWLSEASSCAADVYVDFATDLTKASTPVPRASFDCFGARTPLEVTVCSDTELGRYDLLMSRAYRSFVGVVQGQDKLTLIQNQRAWNASTAGACHLTSAPGGPATLACLRERYRDRMQTLDSCGTGSDVSCLTRSGSN